jgi:hypothetical protein
VSSRTMPIPTDRVKLGVTRGTVDLPCGEEDTDVDGYRVYTPGTSSGTASLLDPPPDTAQQIASATGHGAR